MSAPAARRKPARAQQLGFLQAINRAQHEEMTRDGSVVLMGQDLRANVFGAAAGALEAFGPSRVRDLPLAEAGSIGVAAGAAMAGLRPIVDLTVASFVFGAMDQFVSQLAKARYMFGGQATLPVVVRAALYYQGGTAGHHADRPYPMFMNVPGLKIIVPSTAPDLLGLLKSAIRDDNPVLCFEDANLWGRKGRGPAMPEDVEHLVPLGSAAVRRPGSDVTIVGIGLGSWLAQQAAEELAADGVDAEVIDPRTLVPMDWPTILASVRRTGRCVVVDPANRTCSAASEIAARVVEDCFDALRGPVVRVTTDDTHVPFSPALEKQIYPTQAKVVAAVRRALA
ncbi:pyruvate dehydrogenase E1 component beta subunit [Actinomycetospora succinea]|uniref:Pyruvate dehydrogenase E1 component beta subunit n=1 Tax=Actinomycetospora succinea TaxID=663603 RepID=A0A4R6V4Z5_9PSEU|nr:transketolase C-terminal domain-containing protein [Actinomycetospora succinea]TDQ53918.1 pyruvate dehydrogenase E1 component beta subunit [Actinomycetospora succinea]